MRTFCVFVLDAAVRLLIKFIKSKKINAQYLRHTKINTTNSRAIKVLFACST